MRISDWSSDVCSSDLGRAHMGDKEFPVPILQEDRPDADRADHQRNIAQEQQYPVLGPGVEMEVEAGELQSLHRFPDVAGVEGEGAEAAPEIADEPRSEERRVGNEGVSTCRSRWYAYPYKNNNNKHN